MAVRVELWMNGHLVDGAEQWWDDLELLLGAHEGKYPLLNVVDPYGEFALERRYLYDLTKECQELLQYTSKRTRPFVEKLITLCERGAEATDAELRFIGD